MMRLWKVLSASLLRINICTMVRANVHYIRDRQQVRGRFDLLFVDLVISWSFCGLLCGGRSYHSLGGYEIDAPFALLFTIELVFLCYVLPSCGQCTLMTLRLKKRPLVFNLQRNHASLYFVHHNGAGVRLVCCSAEYGITSAAQFPDRIHCLSIVCVSRLPYHGYAT